MTIPKKIYVKTFWITIILLSAYYLYRAILFRFYKEGLGASFWDKQFWFVAHIVTAIIPLTLGPFQFWNWFRKHHIQWHRRLGNLYIGGCLFGGLTALYLAYTQPYQGSIVPVIILALLWLFMTIAAWVAVINRNIQGHRLFMIRSYTLTLVFVFLRLSGDMIDRFQLLSFIDNGDVRDTTQEWLSWVIPVLTVELFISWLPSLKKIKSSKVNR
ncbi:MAG TPA: DUF2306 domain-containing protein [Flavisolibacter sp.]|nr:DUF2306 domain-containing protein [Flavisolibacter sp.]